jgi:hypothetical protein
LVGATEPPPNANPARTDSGQSPHLGPQIARSSAMLNFSAANLIGGLVFGSIGFVAFIYGKRMHLWKPMLLGIALIIYPYFINDDAILYVIGIFGSTALFFLRD